MVRTAKEEPRDRLAAGTFAVPRRSVVLVVDGVEATSPPIGRMVERHAEPLGAASRAAALLAFDGGRMPLAAIVDVFLPDGCGFELVDELRALDAQLPVVMMSNSLDPAVINRSGAQGLVHLVKPFQAEAVAAFLEGPAVRARRPPFAAHARPSRPTGTHVSAALAAGICRFERRFNLTPKETAVLEHVAQRVVRAEIAAKLGVAESTAKTHVTNLLEKTAQPNLTALLCALLYDVVEHVPLGE